MELITLRTWNEFLAVWPSSEPTYMVDHVDYLIAYAWHPASNARELVEYAHNKKVPTELIENTASKLRISNDKLRTS